MAHKLLLADDSVTIQRVIELTFADEDVQVTAVGDGKQAIEQLQRDRPDIVLADVGMPERDGYEVAAFIKGNPELSHIPVLLLTGAFEPVDDARAKAAGCDGVLVKPFEPQMVISRVKDLLASRKPVSLWGKTPAPQAALQSSAQRSSAFDLRAPDAPGPPSAPAGSLEDYFDRLDAAFATLDGGQADARPTEGAAGAPPDTSKPQFADPVPRQPAPASFNPRDDLAGWDPDLAGDPARPAPAAPSGAERAPAAAEVPPAPAPVAPPAAPVIAASPAIPAAPAPAGTPAAAAAPAATVADSAAAAPADSPAATPADSPAAGPADFPAAAPDDSAAQGLAAAPTPAQCAATAAAPAAELAPTPAGFAAPPAGPMPSLAEAFAALLAAEQGQHFSAAIMPSQAVPDHVIEDIVRRVMSRMTDQAVRQTVGDVAERLVREEIARIKNTAANP